MSDDAEGVKVDEGVEVTEQEVQPTEAADKPAESSPNSEANTEAQVSTDDTTDVQKAEKRKSAQKRIKQLNAKLHSEREAKEAAEKESEALQARISELEGSKPKLEDFDHDESAFQEALVQRTIELHSAKQDQTVAQKAQAEKKSQKAQAVWDDYTVQAEEYKADAGLTDEAFQAKVGDVYAALGSVDPAVATNLELGIAEAGPEVTAYLADNPEELVALIDEPSVISQGIMLNEFRSKIVLQKNASKVSNAPDPVPDIGGGSGGGSLPSTAEEAFNKGGQPGLRAFNQRQPEKKGGIRGRVTVR